MNAKTANRICWFLSGCLIILMVAIVTDVFAAERDNAEPIIDRFMPKTSDESRTNEEKNKLREVVGEYAHLNFQEHQNV